MLANAFRQLGQVEVFAVARTFGFLDDARLLTLTRETAHECLIKSKILLFDNYNFLFSFSQRKDD